MRNPSKLTFTVTNFVKNKGASSNKSYLLKSFWQAKVPQLVLLHGPLVFQGVFAKLCFVFQGDSSHVHFRSSFLRVGNAGAYPKCQNIGYVHCHPTLKRWFSLIYWWDFSLAVVLICVAVYALCRKGQGSLWWAWCEQAHSSIKLIEGKIALYL